MGWQGTREMKKIGEELKRKETGQESVDRTEIWIKSRTQTQSDFPSACLYASLSLTLHRPFRLNLWAEFWNRKCDVEDHHHFLTLIKSMRYYLWGSTNTIIIFTREDKQLKKNCARKVAKKVKDPKSRKHSVSYLSKYMLIC